MQKTGKLLKIIAINIVIFILLLEAVALAIYFIKHKTFFYTDSRNREPRETIQSPLDVDTQAGKTPEQLTDKRFHPFFGYTYKTGSNNTNNYGFICPYDYPFKKEHDDQFIIGIFGGSVADNFYREGCERLSEKLKLNPAFAHKEFVYLNYAMGGYKQPQHLQILSYFLSIGQELDAVINIDGFNEIIFCFNNNRLNLDIAMPSAQHFLPMRDLMESRVLDHNKLESLWKIQQYKEKLTRLRQKLRHTPLAALHLFYSTTYDHLYKSYRAELLRFDQLIKPAKNRDSLVNVKYTPASRDDNYLLAAIASLWSRCSLLMNQAVAVQKPGALYLHILQPNQYYSNKAFTKEEQTYSLDRQTAYSVLAEKGYPVLLREIEVLKKNDVAAYSAVNIFDNVKETLYIDNCCHFNRIGNELLADFIAQCMMQSR